MTHNHVEQDPTAFRILTDHAISFAREYPLTMVAKSFRAHCQEGSNAYATGCLKNLAVDAILTACEKYEAVLLFKQAMSR